MVEVIGPIFKMQIIKIKSLHCQVKEERNISLSNVILWITLFHALIPATSPELSFELQHTLQTGLRLTPSSNKEMENPSCP